MSIPDKKYIERCLSLLPRYQELLPRYKAKISRHDGCGVYELSIALHYVGGKVNRCDGHGKHWVLVKRRINNAKIVQ